MSLGLGINGINSYAYDPYFAYALNAYNPNFQGAQQTVSQPQVTTPAVDTSASTANLPKADYSEKSNAGTVATVVGTLATAGTLIYAYRKGKGTGEGLTRLKNGFKKMFGMEVNTVATQAAETVSKKTPALTEIKVAMKNGKPVYYIPGKTETITDINQINGLMNNKEMRMLTGLRFKSGETTISSGTFNITDKNIKNAVQFDGDKIVKITNENGQDITSQFIKDGKVIENLNSDQYNFVESIKDRIAKIKQGDIDTIFGKDTNLTDFTYTTKIGDNSATVFRPSISVRTNKPQVKSVTKLKEFKADDDAVLAEVRRQREAGHNIDALIAEKFVKKGKLPPNYKVAEFEIKDGDKIVKIVDGKAVGYSIKENGKTKFYKKGCDKFEAYLERNQKFVDDKIADALKDGNIPNGATIVQV